MKGRVLLHVATLNVCTCIQQLDGALDVSSRNRGVESSDPSQTCQKVSGRSVGKEMEENVSKSGSGNISQMLGKDRVLYLCKLTCIF